LSREEWYRLFTAARANRCREWFSRLIGTPDLSGSGSNRVEAAVETGVPAAAPKCDKTWNYSQTGLLAERSPTKHNPNICGVMDNF